MMPYYKKTWWSTCIIWCSTA